MVQIRPGPRSLSGGFSFQARALNREEVINVAARWAAAPPEIDMATPAKPKAKRVGTPRVVPRNGGRKPWKPNDEQRMIVRFLAGRATQETIASVVGTTVDTLVKNCRKEFNEGAAEADLMVEGALFRECMKGNATCIIWWEKTRRRFREVTAHEHSGPGGAPIEHSMNLSMLSDDELMQLDKIQAKLEGEKHPD